MDDGMLTTLSTMRGDGVLSLSATLEQRPMAYGGFEKDRMVLKYVCR